MLRMYHLVVLNGYTTKQALNQMEMPNLSASAAQMWLQIYNVVKTNWPGYQSMQRRSGQAMVPTKFFASNVAKALAPQLMAVYIKEVTKHTRSHNPSWCGAHMHFVCAGRRRWCAC
jgi:hypothetical protein